LCPGAVPKARRGTAIKLHAVLVHKWTDVHQAGQTKDGESSEIKAKVLLAHGLEKQWGWGLSEGVPWLRHNVQMIDGDQEGVAAIGGSGASAEGFPWVADEEGHGS